MFALRSYVRGLRKAGAVTAAIRQAQRVSSAVTSTVTDTHPDQGEEQPVRVQQLRYNHHLSIQPRKAANPYNQQPLDAFIEDVNKDLQIPFTKPGFKSVNRIIEGLSKIEFSITSSLQLYEVRTIFTSTTGVYILEKLSKLAQSGKWPLDPEGVKQAKLIANLARMPRMGPGRVHLLHMAGCNSLEDLYKPGMQQYLSAGQWIGLQYHDHLRQGTSLEAANGLLEFCKKISPPSFEWILAGDHRRGVVSNDITLLLLQADHVDPPLPPRDHLLKALTSFAYPSQFKTPQYPARVKRTSTPLQEILPLLEDEGLVSTNGKKTFKSWNGVIRLPGLNEQEWQDRGSRLQAIRDKRGDYRSLIIHLIPQKSLGAALIHSTGDKEFQKYVNRRARLEKLRLNDSGLWQWVEHEHASHWKMVETYTEESIFHKLGMQYVQPEHRSHADWRIRAISNPHPKKKNFIVPLPEEL
ncbi:hypothetical protein P691DRAFT_771849 [Macrolepiota fuliginosa MF-IS2]|uniref:DNA polymerase n=1 Tax=Macrolepiota fuliginosa MF-IS2 TaxID=1400762 RepID=A0A9P6C5H7_9AGAR|nr:hypothetical protein P691DRAFT_771849 [Macrolepiota fuliginosa MF-IS2]